MRCVHPPILHLFVPEWAEHRAGKRRIKGFQQPPLVAGELWQKNHVSHINRCKDRIPLLKKRSARIEDLLGRNGA